MSANPPSGSPSSWARIVRFGLVGASGVVVNEAVFALVQFAWGDPRDSLGVNIAAIAGFAVSVLTNFWFNDVWTWRDRGQSFDRRAIVQRATSYIAVASVALGVQLVVLNAALALTSLEPLVANLIGIGAGTVINFVVNNLWTFRQRT